MSAVSEHLVREYFELHGFLVRELRKSTAPGDSERRPSPADFAVFNPHASRPSAEMPFELGGDDLGRIRRGAVLVLGWHTKRIYARHAGQRSEIGKFVDRVASAASGFRAGETERVAKLLVAPGLPGGSARERSVAALRDRGVDGMISFDRLLREMIVRVEVNRNYTRSDLLQTLRLLKIYGLLKDPQLEFFGKSRRPR